MRRCRGFLVTIDSTQAQIDFLAGNFSRFEMRVSAGAKVRRPRGHASCAVAEITSWTRIHRPMRFASDYGL
jgi:hypothetical protein